MKFLKVITIILLAICLQGCAALLVGTAAVATRSATDPRSVGTQVDDGTLELRVANALGRDKKLASNSHINAMAYQGKVLLMGQATNQQWADRAKQLANKVEGASTIYNEIRISPLASLGTASTDSWITTKVRSKLLASDKVKSSNVKVSTEKGEVFLMGLVTTEQGKAAADIASRVNGVRRVSTAFTMIKE